MGQTALKRSTAVLKLTITGIPLVAVLA